MATRRAAITSVRQSMEAIVPVTGRIVGRVDALGHVTWRSQVTSTSNVVGIVRGAGPPLRIRLICEATQPVIAISASLLSANCSRLSILGNREKFAKAVVGVLGQKASCRVGLA